jgi:drug/metabolite transporter (DMT)-like permease
MDTLATLLLLTVLLSDTTSHLCLKGASNGVAHLSGGQYWLTLLRKPVLWLGFVVAAIEFLMWVGFLSRVPLGLGVMAGSITIVGVMVGGRFFFGERLTLPRLVAVGSIACGVLLVGSGQP